jgi:inosine-uridine nucleoside N-ribohydrolase
MTKIIFDTDLSLGTPGAEIDDGAALLMLLSAFSDAELMITTVHGNTDVANVNHNLWRLLDWLGRTAVPVGAGAPHALLEEKQWFAKWQQEYGPTPPVDHLPDWPVAAAQICETILAAPEPVTLIAVGR